MVKELFEKYSGVSIKTYTDSFYYNYSVYQIAEIINKSVFDYGSHQEVVPDALILVLISDTATLPPLHYIKQNPT